MTVPLQEIKEEFILEKKKIYWPTGWQKTHTHTHTQVRCNNEVRYQFIYMAFLYIHYGVEN